MRLPGTRFPAASGRNRADCPLSPFCPVLARSFPQGTADEFIHRLNEGGLLLKKGNCMYALLGAGL